MMSKMGRICFAVLLLLLMTGEKARSAPQSFNFEPMRECINRHREFFQEKFNDSAAFAQSAAERHIAFLDRMNEESISAGEWRTELGSLLWTKGRLGKQPAEIQLLIAALDSHDVHICDFALKQLMWNVGHGTRKQYVDQIKKALGGCPESLEAKWLVAKCGVSDQEQEKLLQSKDGNDLLLRSLCGDSNAEEEIITSFQNASDYASMEQWIKPLAFIGSQACSKALINGLASTVFEASNRSYRSIRYPILPVLRLIFEDIDELCTQLLMAPTADRLNALDQWVKDTFGHRAWNYRYVFIYEMRYDSLLQECSCRRREISTNADMQNKNNFSNDISDGPKEGVVWNVDLGNNVRMEFMPIPIGSFEMGSNNLTIHEMPVHTVTFNTPFWLAKTEVTQAQFRQVMGNDHPVTKGDDYPADEITRQLAYQFCRNLTRLEHQSGHLPEEYEYTLPSESQWEYSCQAGSQEDIITNFEGFAWPLNSGSSEWGITHLVAQKQPNKWGLYDMNGNVMEWCSDCYHDTYLGAPSDGSVWGSGSETCCSGIMRGGIVRSRNSKNNSECQPAHRRFIPRPNDSNISLYGFRPVVQPVQQSSWELGTCWETISESNEMIGKFYDLKQTPDGSPTDIGRSMTKQSDGKSMEQAIAKTKIILNEFATNWDIGALSKFMRRKKVIYPCGFMIPEMKAEQVVKEYGMQGLMSPGFWVSYFSGKIDAPETGRYRFCGFGNDLLLVRINKQLVLDASRRGKIGNLSNWNSSDEESGKFQLGNGQMVIGDWFSIERGELVDMEVLIGNLSSDTYFQALLIQQEGRQYRMVQTDNGMRPVLPIFKLVEYPEDLIPQLKIKADEAILEGPIFGAKGQRIIKRKVKRPVQLESAD